MWTFPLPKNLLAILQFCLKLVDLSLHVLWYIQMKESAIKARDQRVFNYWSTNLGEGFSQASFTLYRYFVAGALFTYPLRCVVSLKFLYSVTRARRSNLARTGLQDASFSFHVITDPFIWTDYRHPHLWNFMTSLQITTHRQTEFSYSVSWVSQENLTLHIRTHDFITVVREV